MGLLIRVKIVNLLGDITVRNIRTIKCFEFHYGLIHITLLLISRTQLIEYVLFLVCHTWNLRLRSCQLFRRKIMETFSQISLAKKNKRANPHLGAALSQL